VREPLHRLLGFPDVDDPDPAALEFARDDASLIEMKVI